MKKLTIFISILFISLSLTTDTNEEIESVKVGELEWSVSNYDSKTFPNGETILLVNSAQEWDEAFSAKKPACCYYKYDEENAGLGLIYNYYAVNGNTKLAPDGWHVATYQDWNNAINYLGGKKKAGVKMKSESGWVEGANGTNASGLNLNACGAKDYISWWEKENGTNYWGIKIKSGSFIICRFSILTRKNSVSFQFTNIDSYGAYVRLVKD